MITLAIVLGSIVGYLATGFGIARWDLPDLWRRRKDANTAYGQHWARSEVGWGMAATILLWPLRLPMVLCLRMIHDTNPAVLEQRVKDQQKRIRELERWHEDWQRKQR